MKKYTVHYQGGESRETPGTAIDYMLAVAEDIELYAEAEPIDGNEIVTYDALKAAILDQAAEHDIPAECLIFSYD